MEDSSIPQDVKVPFGTYQTILDKLANPTHVLIREPGEQSGFEVQNKIASEKQIGGDHYKDMPIQPSEYITKNGLGWYEGNAIKYITRYKLKHGKEDIKKAIHYLELLLETLD